MWVVILVVVLLFVWFKFVKPYILKYDNAVLYTGGIGSGKSLLSVSTALKVYRKNLFNWKVKRFFNFLRKKDRQFTDKKPKLYSNMPIRLGKKYCEKLTKDILVMNTKIPPKSVVVIDEISLIANQFNWNINDIKYHLNEFVQCFRHYTKGGMLVLSCQASSEVVKQVRVKLNSYYICSNFHKYWFVYRVDILHRLCGGNDGDVVSTNNMIDEDVKRKWGILPFIRKYDTYYLSERYQNIKTDNVDEEFTQLKSNNILRFENYRSKCDD